MRTWVSSGMVMMLCSCDWQSMFLKWNNIINIRARETIVVSINYFNIYRYLFIIVSPDCWIFIIASCCWMNIIGAKENIVCEKKSTLRTDTLMEIVNAHHWWNCSTLQRRNSRTTFLQNGFLFFFVKHKSNHNMLQLSAKI
jgi:hypothetical protein